MGISGQLGLVIAHFGNWGRAFQNYRVGLILRDCRLRLHPLQIEQRTAQLTGGQLHAELIDRLQQLAGCPAQTLTQRPKRGLAEVAAFGMFDVRFPGDQRDFDIGDRRAG